MDQITTTEAATLLRCSESMVREYEKAGWLSSQTRSGERGRGKRMYFDLGEVMAFKAGNAAGAKAYRESLADQQAAPARRGRRKPVTA